MESEQEILEYLNGLPEDERKRVVEETARSFNKITFIPNPGPQTDAYYSKADILLYGGAAGAGKTGLINGLALSSHTKSHIFRRKYADLSAIAEDLCGMYGSRKGFATMPRPKLRTSDGRLIEFGACQYAGDEQAWQGQAADLKCVARGTGVLMGDGSYKNIEDVVVGDKVSTLEGPKSVNKVFPAQNKPCVKVEVRNNSGDIISSQIQSTTHALLTTEGWVSHDTSCEPPLPLTSGPTLCRGDHKSYVQFLQKFLSFVILPVARILDLARTIKRTLLFEGRRCSTDHGQCGERVPQSYCSCSGAKVAQGYLLQSACVEQPIPIDSVVYAEGNTPKHNRCDQHKYPHPYKREVRYTDQEICTLPFLFTPVDSVDLFDIEVEDVNHYITLGGFVNKNCFDEVTQFLEAQVRYIITWNRSVIEGQRCRVVFASNPPTSADGDWIINYFGPWLDPAHANRAEPGELRWVVSDPDGNDFWTDGPEPHLFPGQAKSVKPKSRTFIPGKLQDNPYLINTDYMATLDALPEPLRSAMRDGNFMLTRSDAEMQVIPSDWIRQAQARWKEEPPEDVAMSCISADTAQGGVDDNVVGWRHDWWFSKQVIVPGKDTPLGSDIAGHIIRYRQHAAKIVIDVGGGYGGSTYKTLKDNEMKCSGYNGAKKGRGKTRDGKLKFVNKRAESWWKFREALDPSQPGGSKIAIPPCQKLASDLAAPTYSLQTNGIKIEEKVAIKKRLGRSPDRGDQVVMCWSEGDKGTAVGALYGKMDSKHGLPPMSGKRNMPQVNMGHDNRRRKR